MYKFPSIESYHNVMKNVRKRLGPSGIDEWLMKPKMHGTQGAIVIEKGVDGEMPSIYAQSRKRVITPDKDNMGFAAFVSSLKPQLELEAARMVEPTVVIYGEWCGKGIQQRDAITQISDNIFAVFGVLLRNVPEDEWEYLQLPTDIWITLDAFGLGREQGVHVIGADVIDQDLTKPSMAEHNASQLSVAAEYIGERDWWVEQEFGVEGPGEGYVVSPLTPDFDVFEKYTFKVKSKAHQEQKNKGNKGAKAHPEQKEGVKEFVQSFVTEPRMKKALSELGIDEPTMEDIGPFLKWVGQDVKKESGDELEASGLEWKDVSKAVQKAAKDWLIEQM